MEINNLKDIKDLLNINIDDEILIRILFDINRYYDKKFTIDTKLIQRNTGRIFNSIERKSLRNYYYYKTDEDLINNQLDTFPTIKYEEDDINRVINNTLFRLKTYDKDKILNSIKSKFENLILYNKSSISHGKEWLSYYNKKREKLFDYSVIILRISNDDFSSHDYNEQYIYNLIMETYNKLENYRHLILLFDGQIFDKKGNDITWKIIYKSTIYAENFVQYKDIYFPCKKEKRIEELNSYLNKKFNDVPVNIANDFYKNISTGYKYEDCYIEKEQNIIIVSLKKIARDESPVPCPSCMTTIQSGNSYPEMFLRSYECKNSNCQDRSKSGRGKRFDEYGTLRNFKLEENNKNNLISEKLYKEWKRDIFDVNADYLQMIIKFYSWDNEKILTYNLNNIHETYSRILVDNYKTKDIDKNFYVKKFSDLPIFKLFYQIKKLIRFNNGKEELLKDIEVRKGDSTLGLAKIKTNQIGTAITSPPYYNAREYSQWSNMLLYYVDMMENANAIYHSITKNGYYLYNIGDIVCEDNVYVQSHMSNRRLPLGFLSCMIFEIVGFNLIENIVWDKGEVQSKRNSTVNLFSGYVKCINCYEHVLVFNKSNIGINHKKVVKINPVIKINNKKENLYKHTAPYPIELVSLIEPYIIQDKYVLDPYLGSGTTLKWCKRNNYKGLGYELNDEYFELANNKIKEED